ncbi:MAG: beta-propeller fold lactonase family protein, partial [Bacteroidota bacterium]
MKSYSLLLIGLVTASLLCFSGCQPTSPSEQVRAEEPADSQHQLPLYIGTYTRKEGHVDGKASGIYFATLDARTGSIAVQDSTAGIINPSFVKMSLDGKSLYAVSEVGEGEIYAYSVGEDFTLSFRNKIPSGALAPCHIAVDATDRFVIVSNYGGGVVNVCERTPSGGLVELQRLTLNGPDDDAATHAHSATFSPDNKQVFIMDLGKDRIWS